MNLGENIYRLRTECNLSQGDLADALEVSRQSVSKWENNSAVPELEKLIKMAQIFDITIDELVTGEATEDMPVDTSTPSEEPRVVYIEHPTRPAITPAQILGIMLTACSLLALILLVCFGWRIDIEDAFLLCLPVAVCGILCMVTKHPLLWCSWAGSLGFWIYVFILSYRWENEVLLLLLGILLVAGALFYTIWLHKKGAIHVPAWLWGLLTIILAMAALLLMLNLLPSATGSVTRPTEVIIYPE